MWFIEWEEMFRDTWAKPVEEGIHNHHSHVQSPKPTSYIEDNCYKISRGPQLKISGGHNWFNDKHIIDNEMKFTTKDSDNNIDINSNRNCALAY